MCISFSSLVKDKTVFSSIVLKKNVYQTFDGFASLMNLLNFPSLYGEFYDFAHVNTA